MINDITKHSDIKKEIVCPHCNKGTRKINTFYVEPKSGRVAIEYSWCTYCNNKHNLTVWTYIIIPELKIGDK